MFLSTWHIDINVDRPVTPCVRDINVDWSVTPCVSDINVDRPVTPCVSDINVDWPVTPCVRDMDLPSASAQQMIGLHWRGGRTSFLSQWWHSCLYMAVIRYLCIYCWSTLCVIFWHRSVRPSHGHISKTNQDRPVVTVEHYKEVDTTDTAAALMSCRDALCGDILVS